MTIWKSLRLSWVRKSEYLSSKKNNASRGSKISRTEYQSLCVFNDEGEIETDSMTEAAERSLQLGCSSMEVRKTLEVWDCRDCGVKIQKRINMDCDECGEGISEEELHLILVGLDVVALFPSMKSKSTGKIIRKMIMNRPISICHRPSSRSSQIGAENSFDDIQNTGVEI